MRIVHYSTSLGGGAGRAMINLNNALRACGADSWVASFDNPTNYPYCIQILPPKSTDFCPEQAALQTMSKYVNEEHRTSISNTLFSADYLGVDLLESAQLSDFDIHNFHWVVGFVHPFTVRALLEKGNAVVWTLHDMWAFTGGCHYSAGCNQYTLSCQDCPQIIGDGTRFVSSWMQAKRLMLNRQDLTVTAPSKWLAHEAAKSAVFRSARVEALPNTIDVDRFSPADPSERADLRKRLGIAEDELAAVVISQNFEEQRKGYAVLLDALEELNIQGDLDGKKLTLVCVGFNGDGLEVPGVRVIATGTLENDQEMRNVLAAADFAIQCALEENYSNVILETMACGLPVLASTAGGNAELVKHKENGWLYAVDGGASILAQTLRENVLASTFNEMRVAARETACAHDSRKIAPLYLELYTDLLAKRGKLGSASLGGSASLKNANTKSTAAASSLESQSSSAPPAAERLQWQKNKSFSLADLTPADAQHVAAIRQNVMSSLMETYQGSQAFNASKQNGASAARRNYSLNTRVNSEASLAQNAVQTHAALGQSHNGQAEGLRSGEEASQPFNSDYVNILEQRMLRAYRHIRELDQTVRGLQHSEQALAQELQKLKQAQSYQQLLTENPKPLLAQPDNSEAARLEPEAQNESSSLIAEQGNVTPETMVQSEAAPLEPVRTNATTPNSEPLPLSIPARAVASAVQAKRVGPCLPRVIRPYGIPELPSEKPFVLSPKFKFTFLHRKWLHRKIGPWFNPDWYRSRNKLTGADAQNPLLHFSSIGIAANYSPSPLFDADYYLSIYPDVAVLGIPAFWHFITRGLKEQRSPNRFFDPKFYLESYPDVMSQKSGATAHFVQKGLYELRAPHVMFDPEYYLDKNPDVADSKANPFLHFLEFGLAEGRSGSAIFDSHFYEAMYPEVLLSGLAPMDHFMKVGLGADYQPNPLFDPEFYLERYSDVKQSGMKAFEHFLVYGMKEHRQPHPLFDTKYYLSLYPDVNDAKTPAYIHFLKHGMKEDRRPHPLFDPQHYRSSWRDFAALRMTPFEHFLRIGIYEGRSPNGLFSPSGFERLFGGKLREDMPIFEQYLRYNLV